MSDLQIVDSFVKHGELEKALALLSELIDKHPGDASLMFYRGKLQWRMGRHSSAMTDYAHAVELDPESPARHALQQAREIAGFFNPDLYNP